MPHGGLPGSAIALHWGREMAEFAAHGYPKVADLRAGPTITVRPLAEDDGERLHAFFNALPASDRHFMKDDVTDPAIARKWAANGDRSRTLALIALDGERIVADAALLRHRGAAHQHQAEVRINILPDYQGHGLGTALIRQLAEIAWEADIELLEFRLVEPQQSTAIAAVSGLGAYIVATLADYLRDAQGNPCDLAVYLLPLGAWFKF